MKFCSQCGTQLNDKAKFCPICATPVVPVTEIPQPPVCKRCGGLIEEGTNYCPNCGTPYGETRSYNNEDTEILEETSVSNNGHTGMRIWGILFMIAGGALSSYGSSLNNSLEAQLNSFLSSGAKNPGTVWITFGVLSIVLGLVLLIAGFQKD